MGTAFIIGNGESRAIFPINELKNKGIIYGCNAIYRDYPTLCDKIVSVNPEMSIELDQARKNNKIPKTTKIYSTIITKAKKKQSRTKTKYLEIKQ